MKKIVLIIMVVSGMNIFLYSQKINTAYEDNYSFSGIIDVNRFKITLNNKGVLADVTYNGKQGGTYDGPICLYSGGFYLCGKRGNNIWANAVASASRIQDYLPGKVGSNVPDSINALYIVRSSDTPFGQSWTKWATAVNLGADFYDGNHDNIYNPVDLNNNGQWDIGEDKPDMLGDITAFCVYNDGVPDSLRRFNDVNPLGIEIHQTVFAYTDSTTNSLNNAIFIRYKIINTGTVASRLDSCFFALWSDPDVGYYSHNLVGCDTIHNTGICYNVNDDQYYVTNSPAFFEKILQGPIAYIPGVTFIDSNNNGEFDEGEIPLDTAKNLRGALLGIQKFPGAKNLPITSFNHYLNSHPTLGDPNTKEEVFNYLRGLDKLGQTLNPCTWTYGTVYGVNCNLINPSYWYSGDPVTNYGWINNSEQDQRMDVNTGPFRLEINKPITIIAAYIVGRGESHLNSISVARRISNNVNHFYKSNFTDYLTHTEYENNKIIADNFYLYQNYPNPFNPSTTIRYQVNKLCNVKLKIYDLLGNEVATLINEEKSMGRYEIEFNAGNYNLSNGIYFYQLSAGSYTKMRKMVLIK